MLVFGFCTDRSAFYVIYNDSLVLFIVWLLAFHNVYDVCFAQRVVFCAAAYEQFYRAFKVRDCQLVANGFYNVVARHDTQLGVKSLEHTQIRVVCPVEHTRVNFINDYMFFYHRRN